MHSFLRAPNVIQRNIKKGKGKIKRGGKTKVGVALVSTIASPPIYIPNMWTSLIMATLVPMAFGHETPLSPSIHHHSHETHQLKDEPGPIFPLRG